METIHRLKQAKSIPEDRKIQDGDPRIDKNIFEYRGMGDINRPTRRLPPYSNSPKIPKMPAICIQVSDLSVHLSSIRASPSSSSILHDSKRGKTHGLIMGHKDTPISGRLADQGSISGGVISQHKSGGRPNQSLGWMINQVKSELIPTQVFSFVGYEYHLNSALVKPTRERWQKVQALILRITNQSALTARHLMSLIGLLASTEKMVPEGRLHMRPFQWHLKENWTFPQSLDKLLPWSDSIIAHLDWWQNPQNVLKGADLHLQEHNVQVFTRRLKRSLGCSLKSRFYQRTVVRSRKIIAHKRFRTKGSVLGPKTLQASMPKSNSPGCHGQLSGSSLHQQTGRDSLSRDVRPSMEDHELVSLIQNISTCQTHSRVPKCDCGLPVQINSNSVNGVVSTPSGVQKNLHKVVHTSGGFVCHSAKPQVATICLSSSRSKRMEHRCSKHKLVKPCSLCLSSNSSTSKSNTKGPPVQLPPNPDSPRLAGHALVLGSGPSISGNSTSVACISKSTQAVKQPGVSQQYAISQPPCLVSRSEQLQEQGFSSEVAERIAAPQRSSTRSIYQAK